MREVHNFNASNQSLSIFSIFRQMTRLLRRVTDRAESEGTARKTHFTCMWRDGALWIIDAIFMSSQLREKIVRVQQF